MLGACCRRPPTTGRAYTHFRLLFSIAAFHNLFESSSDAGMLSVLPAPITTFAACPVPLAVAGDRSSGCGRGGDAATVVAAVTAGGGLEVATIRRGTLSPLSVTVSLSLGKC